MRIGIDLDNTIINYHKLFNLECKRIIHSNKKPKDISSIFFTKEKTKNYIIKNFSLEKWIYIQNLVYAKKIHFAEIDDHFLNFLKFCKDLNYEIFIISHKTKFSNIFKNINLRNESINFLKAKKIFQRKLVKKKNIFFYSEREKKIEKIKKMKLDYYIDDLKVVLENLNKKKTNLILFSDINCKSYKTFSNWLGINKFFFGSQNFKNIIKKKYLNKEFNGYKIINNFQKSNNIIFKLKKKKILFAKFFLKKNYEFFNINKLQKFNFKFVPQLLFSSKDNKLIVVEFLEGKKIKNFNKKILKMSVEILNKLFDLKNNTFKYASSSILSYSQAVNQIEKRLQNLKLQTNTENNLISKHINNIEIFLKSVLKFNRANNLIYKKIPNNLLVLSPSDFGIHNFILKDGNLKLVDYEYMGKDDPAKLLLDILFHPRNKIDANKKKFFINYFIKKFNHDSTFTKRFFSLYYLVGIIWTLIILNVFLNKNSIKVFLGEINKNDLRERLKNSKKLLRCLMASFNRNKTKIYG